LHTKLTTKQYIFSGAKFIVVVLTLSEQERTTPRTTWKASDLCPIFEFRK